MAHDVHRPHDKLFRTVAGVEWPVIEAATGIGQDALRALRQRLEGSEEGTKEAD